MRVASTSRARDCKFVLFRRDMSPQSPVLSRSRVYAEIDTRFAQFPSPENQEIIVVRENVSSTALDRLIKLEVDTENRGT